MKKVRRQKLYLLLGLFTVVFLINIPVIYTYFYYDITGAPKAVEGTMDLSQINQEEGKVYLGGEWEFYWNRFIKSELDPRLEPDLFIEVPDSWSRYKIKDMRLSAKGYASYRILLTGYEYDKEVSLHVPDFGGAYRVYIDGQLASESGTISENNDEIFTVPKADIYPVLLGEGTTHEIVIEVATTRFSGLYMTPILDDYNHIVREGSIRNSVRLVLFGIALFSLFSLIAIYLLAIKRKLLSFWLLVMIIFILLRIMLTAEFYSIWQPILFFNISYEATNELMYLATFVLKYLLLFLVQEFGGIKFIKREKIGFLGYYATLYLIYLLVPSDIYNHYLSVVVPMLTYVLELYLFVKIYCGWQSMKKFGMVIFWSAGLIILGLAIDSYYINGKIYMNMSLSLLLLFTIFSIIMSWVYAMRTGDIYDDFINSSSRLELANNQITMQKEYYSALSGQMNEIREIKHDIRHFIGTMSRLVEANRIDELKDFLSEYCEKTGMEQLPVFCENIIANSIIGYYYLRAKEYGIHFESRCNIGNQITMSESDLCIVLGNALENAIDACRLMDPTTPRFVLIEATKMNGQRLIKVENSFDGRIEMKDGGYISLKGGKSHGLGIPNIKKVMESYEGFLKLDNDKNKFIFMAATPEKQ